MLENELQKFGLQIQAELGLEILNPAFYHQKIVRDWLRNSIQSPSTELINRCLREGRLGDEEYNFVALQNENITKNNAAPLDSLFALKNICIESYEGFVFCPFFKGGFLRDRSLLKGKKIKFLLIDDSLVHAYQMRFVNELMTSVLYRNDALTVVVKIEMANLNLKSKYYLAVQHSELEHVSLEQLLPEPDSNNLPITNLDNFSVFQQMISEIFALPTQHWRSEFDVVKFNDSNRLNKKLFLNTNDYQILDHPALRNPLLYFNKYFNTFSIPICEFHLVIDKQSLCYNFYSFLNLLTKCMQSDYLCCDGSPSLSLHPKTIKDIWHNYRLLIQANNWVEEVLQSTKDSFTLAEFIAKLQPILNEAIVPEAFTYEQYLVYSRKVKVTDLMRRTASSEAKDRYKQNRADVKNIQNETNNEIRCLFHKSKWEIFKFFHLSIVINLDLTGLEAVENLMLLNLLACHLNLEENFENAESLPLNTFHPSWRCAKVWEEAYQIGTLLPVAKYVSLRLDMLCCLLSLDSFLSNIESFKWLQNETESLETCVLIRCFVRYLQRKRGKERYLSRLLQEAFLLEMYTIGQVLVEESVQTFSLKGIFEWNSHAGDRGRLISIMKQNSIQMHRKFIWEEILWNIVKSGSSHRQNELMPIQKNINLHSSAESSFNVVSEYFLAAFLPAKNEKKESLFQSLFSKFLSDVFTMRTVLDGEIKETKLINTIICLTKTGLEAVTASTILKYLLKITQIYLEKPRYAFLRQVYSIFLEELGLSRLQINFSELYNFKMEIIHILEHNENTVTMEFMNRQHKELGTFSKINIHDYEDGVIFSLALLSDGLRFKHIYVAEESNRRRKARNEINETQKTQLNFSEDAILLPEKNYLYFDFFDYYQEVPFQIIGDEPELLCKNSLFLFNRMLSPLSVLTLEKYSMIDPTTLIASVFEKLSKSLLKIRELKNSYSKLNDEKYEKECPSKTSFQGMVFPPNFVTNLCNRLLTIRRCCLQSLEENQSLTALQLMQRVSPTMAIFYSEAIASSQSLLEREQCFENSWRGPLMHSVTFAGMLTLKNEFIKRRFQFEINNCKGPKECAWELAINKSIIDNAYNGKFSAMNDNISKLEEVFSVSSTEGLLNENVNEISNRKLQNLTLRNFDELPSFIPNKLKVLCLETCKFTDEALRLVLCRCSQLKNLQLRNLPTLCEIVDETWTKEPLRLNYLRSVTITECLSLTQVKLDCPFVQYVILTDNPCLKRMSIQAPFCMQIKNCSSIQDVGVYILAGVNMLSDKKAIFTPNAHFNYSLLLTRLLLTIALPPFSPYFRELLKNVYQNYEGAEAFLLNKKWTESANNIIIINRLCEVFLANDAIKVFYANEFGSCSKIIAQLLERVNYDHEYEVIDCVGNEEELLKYVKLKEGGKIIVEGGNNAVSLIDCKVKKSVVEIRNWIVSIQEFLYCMKKWKNILELTLKTLIIRNDNNSYEHFKEERINKQELYSILLNKENDKDENVKCDDKENEKKYESENIKFLEEKKDEININNNNYFFELLLQNKCEEIIKSEKLKEINEKEETKKRRESEQDEGIENEKNNSNDVNNSNKNIKSNNIIEKILINNTENNASKLQTYEEKQRLTELRDDANKIVILSLDKIECLSFPLHIFQNLLELRIHAPSIELGIGTLWTCLPSTLTLLELSALQRPYSIPLLFDNLHALTALEIEATPLNLSEQKELQKGLQKVKLEKIKLEQVVDNECIDFLTDVLCEFIWVSLIFVNKNAVKKVLNGLKKNEKLKKLHLEISDKLDPILIDSLRFNNIELTSNQFLADCVNNKKEVEQYENYYFREHPNDSYQMGLSLDGGGMRGLIQSASLNYLETNLRRPLHKAFDYFGGTSIGGIIALTLCGSRDSIHPACTTEEIIELFDIHGRHIFNGGTLRQFAYAKYDSEYLYSLVTKFFENKKLSDLLPNTYALIPAVNRINNQPHIFKSWHAQFDETQDFFLRDVARATSAAPHYFTSAVFEDVAGTKEYDMIDGGVGFNNPANAVANELKQSAHTHQTHGRYFLLTMGTGRFQANPIDSNAGIIHVGEAINALNEAPTFFAWEECKINHAGHLLRVDPYFNGKRPDLAEHSELVRQQYKEIGLREARDVFNEQRYGLNQDRSFIQWLIENTDRKCDP